MKPSFIMRLTILLSTFMLCQTVFAVSDDTKIENFRYMSKQAVTLNSDETFFILDIEPSIFEKMDIALRDFRLFVDDYELGYSLIPIERENKNILQQERKLEVINQGMLSDEIYSFVILTSDVNRNQSIEVNLNQDTYLVKGSLYGSNDNRNWQKLQPLTLFNIENYTNQIYLSGIDYDYLKIDFKQPEGETLAVEEVVLLSEEEKNRDQISTFEKVPFETSTDNDKNESYIIMDMKYFNRISSEWILSTNEKGFYRQVFMEGSNDEENWEPLCSTYIYRGIEEGDENLSLKYTPSHYRYLRLRIIDKDNEPLIINSMKVKIHPVKILVKTPSSVEKSSMQLEAYWANDMIKAPSYDISQLIGDIDYKNLKTIYLSHQTDNPEYNPTIQNKPLTERYPFILPLGIIIAALVVGYVLYLNIIRMKNS